MTAVYVEFGADIEELVNLINKVVDKQKYDPKTRILSLLTHLVLTIANDLETDDDCETAINLVRNAIDHLETGFPDVTDHSE